MIHKKMNKKAQAWIWFVVGAVVLILILVFAFRGGEEEFECGGIAGIACPEGFSCELFDPNIADSGGSCVLIPGEVSCLDDPNNANCVCPVGLVRMGDVPPFTCEEEEIEPPTGLTLPLTTYEEAEEWGRDIFGENWKCDGPDDGGTLGLLTGELPLDEFGYYGSRYTSSDGIHGYIVMNECRRTLEYDEQGRPKSGVTLINLRFDPNNGWTWELFCNSERLENCPEDSAGNLIRISRDLSENPDFDVYMDLPFP